MKLIDPRTGQTFEGPDENAEAAKQQYGLVTPEDYALQQEHGGLGSQINAAAGKGIVAFGEVGRHINDALGGEAGPPIEINPDVRANFEADVQANPRAAAIGKALGELPAYAALGAATGGIGAGVAELAGAAPALGAAAGIGAESAALGGAQEYSEAKEQARPISAENVAKNGLINLALSAAFPALGGAYNAVFGELRPLARAVQETVSRSAKAGENLADPLVANEAAGVLHGRIEETVGKLQSAVEASSAKVVPNLQAQRDALSSVAEALRANSPDVATALDEAATLPGQRAYQKLRELAAGDHGEEVANELLDVVQDRALWGDNAVEHHNAVEAVKAAGADPVKLAEAARGVPDSNVDKLLADLDQHVEDQTRLAGAQAFGERSAGEHASTVSAAHESFTDTDYETAIKQIADGKYKNAPLLAQEAPGLRNLAAKDFAYSLDQANEVFHDDLSKLSKFDDFKAGAEAWSGRLIGRQDKWLAGQIEELRAAQGKIAEAMSSGRYPLHGMGTKAQEILSTGIARIEAATGGQRMAMIDGLKSQLDSFVMRAGRFSPNVDQYSRRFLTDTLEPQAHSLRAALQDSKLFGRNLAALQRDTNEALTSSLNSIGRIQNELTEKVRQIYGDTGPDPFERLAKPETIERILASPEGGGKGFKRDLAAMLDGLDRLAAARKAHGLTKLDRIDELRAGIENMRKQYDFATVLRAAEKHGGVGGAHGGGGVSGGAAIGANVAIHAAEFAGRAVGFPIGNAVRSMGAYSKLGHFIDETVKPALGMKPSALVSDAGSAVDRVIASHLKRFSSLPEMSDVDVTHVILGDKTRQALRAAGAPIAAPTPKTRGGVPPSAPTGGAAPSEAYQRARAILDRRGGQSGAVEIGSPSKSPVSLAGMSLDDLRANPRPDSMKPETLDALRTGKGGRNDFARDFGATGRVDQKGQLEQGIQVEMGPNGPTLVDGRHRLMVGREKGLAEIYGQVYQGRRMPGKKPIYEGMIPIADSKEAGFADVAGGVATSPMGAAIGLGAAGLGGAALLHEPTQHPDEQPHAEYLAADSQRDTTSTARALTDPGYASELTRRMGGAPSTIELFQGEHASIQQAFMSQRDSVQRMMRDPGALTDSLASALGGVSPELRDALGVKAMQVATYLHTELPPQRGVSVTRPNGLPPSSLEARAYALKFMTATKPSTAFDDAKRGYLRHEQVDSLKANWPELYDDLSSQTLDAMGAGRSSITQRMRANLLFGFGSALDPAFSPALSAAATMGRQQRAQAAQGPGSAPKANTSSLTPQGIQALNR